MLAMLQVLGDRADRDAATPPAGTPPRPSLLVKALSYPDPQVQFTAATALLRSPVPVPPEVRGTDRGHPPSRRRCGSRRTSERRKERRSSPTRARPRSDATAWLLRGLGYNVEVFKTGRDLQRRIARASDFDIDPDRPPHAQSRT